MNICVYGASSDSIRGVYIQETERFGKELALMGHTLVFGGGATGLLGAAARGAYSAGGNIIGIAPSYFDKPGILFENCSEMIHTDNLKERKRLMEEKSDAFVMLPGGIGTFDEFFETIVMRQLGEHEKPVAVFNINNYYSLLDDLIKKARDEGFLPQSAQGLYGVFSDIKMLLGYLKENKPEY